MMDLKKLLGISLAGMFSFFSFACLAQPKVEQWGRFEDTFKGPSSGNPFMEVEVKADFWQPGGNDTIRVSGFYDGGGRYVIRFMPSVSGTWKYRTMSNVPALSGKSGSLQCTPAVENRGPVKVKGVHGFQFADGTAYYPLGTTAYAWVHMPEGIQEQTLASLDAAKFNKLRMCVFPKCYDLCKEEPAMYPFPVKNGDVQTKGASGRPSMEEGSSTKQKKNQGLEASGKSSMKKLPASGKEFDFSRFNPAFFRHLEKRIDELKAMGVEADLILFHPYDKGQWGFDSMPEEVNKAYIRYLCARLASFSNVWWSLANEYDYVKAKTEEDWVTLIKTVRASDPYGHLCSIHGSTATYFPYWMEELTHTSIQDEAPVEEAGRASILYSIYRKPVVMDEVCYEGNLSSRWGRLSGPEMLHRIWQGMMNGIYVTHGECYKYHEDADTIFWAKGGLWRGESWKRIPFTRRVIESLPNALQMADISRDSRTATAGEGCYLVYFGKAMQDAWTFNLPAKNAQYKKLTPGTKFKVEIIDTWNMTITPCPEIMVTGPVTDYRLYDTKYRKIRLPLVPYLLLRITEVEAD